ncbi:15516_t:CDS:1 [Dentiscutata erythropus]|uniref:15516_t:CDS:1 n=1 Tax=Dentiscutata erythropus TaxID=1348616 RepID=A0A9N9HW89_9GLOM|nr:15516_t:CDS:1 [Dentiscutata erythropus]
MNSGITDPDSSSTTGIGTTSPVPTDGVAFTVLCAAAIALVITAAALFFVTRKKLQPDELDKSENGLYRKNSFSDEIFLKNNNSKDSIPHSLGIPRDQPKEVKPSTPPSTGSATPAAIFPQLNTQAPFDLSPDFFNTPPKAHKSLISRSRSSLDLSPRKEKEEPPFSSETTPFNDSPGPPLGSVHHVPRIESEQLGESPYMTSHHHSTDFLQEMPSPMRHEYSTSPVRSPRTSGDVRPQSRQSSDYMAQSPQEFQDPQYHSTFDESNIYTEGSPINLEPSTTRSERSERSRSRGRSLSPYIHRHASPYEPTEFDDTDIGDQPHPSVSRSSESPSPPPTERRRPPRGGIYTPEDSAGAPLTSSASITRRARSARRQGQRRGGGSNSGAT